MNKISAIISYCIQALSHSKSHLFGTVFCFHQKEQSCPRRSSQPPRLRRTECRIRESIRWLVIRGTRIQNLKNRPIMRLFEKLKHILLSRQILFYCLYTFKYYNNEFEVLNENERKIYRVCTRCNKAPICFLHLT